MAHTPGPWKWEFSGSAGSWYLWSGDRPLPIGGPPDIDPTAGDMALIAAAPDLLEALTDVLDAIGALSNPHELTGLGLGQEAQDRIFSAIAKAEGRS